jgi:hypothetical protein
LAVLGERDGTDAAPGATTFLIFGGARPTQGDLKDFTAVKKGCLNIQQLGIVFFKMASTYNGFAFFLPFLRRLM